MAVTLGSLIKKQITDLQTKIEQPAEEATPASGLSRFVPSLRSKKPTHVDLEQLANRIVEVANQRGLVVPEDLVPEVETQLTDAPLSKKQGRQLLGLVKMASMEALARVVRGGLGAAIDVATPLKTAKINPLPDPGECESLQDMSLAMAELAFAFNSAQQKLEGTRLEFAYAMPDGTPLGQAAGHQGIVKNEHIIVGLRWIDGERSGFVDGVEPFLAKGDFSALKMWWQQNGVYSKLTNPAGLAESVKSSRNKAAQHDLRATALTKLGAAMSRGDRTALRVIAKALLDEGVTIYSSGLPLKTPEDVLNARINNNAIFIGDSKNATHSWSDFLPVLKSVSE